MAGATGLEPATSGVTGRRSLSRRPPRGSGGLKGPRPPLVNAHPRGGLNGRVPLGKPRNIVLELSPASVDPPPPGANAREISSVGNGMSAESGLPFCQSLTRRRVLQVCQNIVFHRRPRRSPGADRGARACGQQCVDARGQQARLVRHVARVFRAISACASSSATNSASIAASRSVPDDVLITSGSARASN